MLILLVKESNLTLFGLIINIKTPLGLHYSQYRQVYNSHFFMLINLAFNE